MSWAKTDTTNYSNIADKLRVQKPNQTFLPSEMDNVVDDINRDIADTYTACQNKGATLPQSQISANLAQTVMDIPEKDVNENFDKFMNNTLTKYSTTATRIPDNCFRNKTAMIDIDMPNVTSIENSAFWGCTNLSITSLPASLTSIGESAFRGCYNLAISEIPNGISVISTAAFYGCQKISITKFTDNIRSIRANSFYRCIGIPFIDVSEMTSIPGLSVDAFLNTTFPFYFRDQQQLDEWAAATNWSSLASRFQIKPSEVL